MKYSDIKFDCLHFKGEIPCLPNKLRNKMCDSCDEYIKINKRILIIKLGAIGDVIRTTPLLSKFKELYPDSQITWITNSPNILPSDLIQQILPFNASSVLTVQGCEFDIAVNLDKDKEACILLKNVNAKEKFGYTWDNNHLHGLNKAAEDKILTGLFDNISKQNKKSYQEEIFEICGMKFTREPNILNVDYNFNKKWEIISEKASGKKIIGLNTGCGSRWPTRLWKPENWESLILKLSDAGYFPMVLGGVDEDAQNIKYAQSTGVYYPGTYSLQEFIAIVNKCDVVVTAVSMAMHIASGLNKPIVLFNNIFNKYEFELYGKGIIIEPPDGCDCYYGRKCVRDVHCMEGITPQSVFDKIKTLSFTG